MQSATNSATITTSSTTYATAVGAPSLTVTGAHTVLLTLTIAGSNTNNDRSCLMSFAASGGLTLAASDDRAAGAAAGAAIPFATSATYLFTTTGNTTFSAQYRASANTCTFTRSNIIAQVY